MNISKPLITMMVTTLVASAVKAECGTTGCVDYIDQVYIEANGGLYVQTSGNETLANCQPDSGVYLHLPGMAAKFKEVYAMLLYAQAMGLRMNIRVVEGSNPCQISWAAVNRS